jgi:DNA-binding CsgD family transcriptional regulator
VLVVVDDAQWLDRRTGDALGAIARRLDGFSIGLLAAVRTGPESFFDHSGLPELQLGPLPADSALALVDTVFPDLVPHVRRRVVEVAAGNALALLELPRALTQDQREGAAPLPTTLPLGPRLERLFASRIARLPAAARHVLLLAALERNGDLDVLARAAGGGPIAEWQPAERAGLIALDHDVRRLTFRHPLVRSTIVELSGSGDRQACHRALAQQVAEPERRAWHRAAAADRPDESVASSLERVAHDVLDRGDAAGAIAALLRAAELTPDRQQRGERLAQAAMIGVALHGGLRTAAELVAEMNRGEGLPIGSLPAATAAALVLSHKDGDLRTCAALLSRTLLERGEVLDADDPEVVAGMYAMLSLHWMSQDPAAWQTFTTLLGRLRPAAPKQLRLLAATGVDVVRTSPETLHALEEAARDADPQLAVHLIGAALVIDRGEAICPAWWSIVRDAREKEDAGQPPALPAVPALIGLAWAAFWAGRWEECEETAQEGLDAAERLGYGIANWALNAAQCGVAAARGDHDRVRQVTDEVIAWATPRHIGGAVETCRIVRALSAASRGDYETAYRETTSVNPPGVVLPGVRRPTSFILDLVEAAVRTGRLDEARAHAAALRDAGMARLSPRGDMLVHTALALTSEDDAAAPLFATALAVPGASLWAFEHARVRLLAGEHLRRRRAVVEARDHLVLAQETFTRLRARPWMDRAAIEIGACGGRGQSSSPLTPQEQEVARLAATGLSNRHIGERLGLSPRTVSIHLYRAFPKLGVTSRAALGAVLGLHDHR